MPKTIDYPRTTYLSAWEVSEIVDDTGGKCSIEACARKLNRKVSGSFKAILGSAVKFGLLTSKREMLTTTNLFRRIKHAYDKQEEKIFHREAFLHPPLFSHICRKFRNRELPVHMFDVMLVREFGVEEINAQNVARAFVEGARMVGVLDERNVIADIDQLAQASPRRDVASPEMNLNLFRTDHEQLGASVAPSAGGALHSAPQTDDAVSSLFGLSVPLSTSVTPGPGIRPVPTDGYTIPAAVQAVNTPAGSAANTPSIPQAEALYTTQTHAAPVATVASAVVPNQHEHTATPDTAAVDNASGSYTIRITGPGLDSQLSLQDEADLAIVHALLEKIRKHLGR
ncbi:hypothetical protein [Solirubrum puertoriconensis]|uniref:Uncharacterized protein n=1 Tax=Solirubrum puertoriconensis TaxID=1751427 RepID=A0A9X0HKX8_SOLP1|nr:hypothetical protein [Solirubrum puertoriconensis]KUG07801.1 hypothetical protein ASU33_15960 [Solirubrum puertoriconensis]